MMGILVAVVLYALIRKVFSGWQMLFKRSRRLDKQSFRWPLCRCCCYKEVLHFVAGSSWFCWEQDWLRLFQRIINSGCGGDRERNPQFGVGRSRWGRCAGCWNALLSAIDAIGVRWRKLLWNVLLGFCSKKYFRSHILHLLSNCLGGSLWFEMGNPLPFSQCLEKGEGGSIQWTCTLCCL